MTVVGKNRWDPDFETSICQYELGAKHSYTELLMEFVRVVDGNEEISSTTLLLLCEICKSTLETEKYNPFPLSNLTAEKPTWQENMLYGIIL